VKSDCPWRSGMTCIFTPTLAMFSPQRVTGHFRSFESRTRPLTHLRPPAVAFGCRSHPVGGWNWTRVSEKPMVLDASRAPCSCDHQEGPVLFLF
jgi:hypothetical protein